MSWAKALAAIVKTSLDWRAWMAALVIGLALSLWVVTAERDRAGDRIEALNGDVVDLHRDLSAANAAKASEQRAKLKAEGELSAYAQTTLSNFQKQAEESARMSAQLAELNRRVRAAQQEIARADGSLRLDDPLPRSVRDSLACAGGDERACPAATAAPAGGMPGGAADPAGPAVPVARGRVGA